MVASYGKGYFGYKSDAAQNCQCTWLLSVYLMLLFFVCLFAFLCVSFFFFFFLEICVILPRQTRKYPYCS